MAMKVSTPFLLKMFEIQTGADKGWLSASTGNNVELVYGDTGKAKASWCVWVDDTPDDRWHPPHPVYLKLRDYERALGIGNNGAAEWGDWAIPSGWYNKLWNLENRIQLDEGGFGKGRCMIPNSDGWSVRWGHNKDYWLGFKEVQN
jgi:hypothetical protein